MRDPSEAKKPPNPPRCVPPADADEDELLPEDELLSPEDPK